MPSVIMPSVGAPFLKPTTKIGPVSRSPQSRPTASIKNVRNPTHQLIGHLHYRTLLNFLFRDFDSILFWRHDTQQNDPRHNDIHHNAIQKFGPQPN
jgi:hypothetical protein